jgi:hypothetical protein
MKISIATVTTRKGYTSKDHLLTEIASAARDTLKASYSSRSAAIKAAERAIYGVIASRSLYSGCAAGLVGGAA